MRPLCQLITVLMLLVSAVTADAGKSEYQVKAAMLYNFAKFVEWPADSFGGDGRIMFCIAGDSPLNGPVQQMQGKSVKGRTVVIRQIARPEEVSGCHVLFIPQSEYARMSAYLKYVSHHSILTVSELERFLTSGGTIGFYEEDSKVRFEINQDAARKQGLQISSHLLNLARRVR